MIYYTKKGEPTFVPQTDEDRFGVWVEKISDWRRVGAVAVKDKFGRLLRDDFGNIVYANPGKIMGTGIAEPTDAELAHVYAKPCRYWRAARASHA